MINPTFLPAENETDSVARRDGPGLPLCRGGNFRPRRKHQYKQNTQTNTSHAKGNSETASRQDRKKEGQGQGGEKWNLSYK